MNKFSRVLSFLSFLLVFNCFFLLSWFQQGGFLSCFRLFWMAWLGCCLITFFLLPCYHGLLLVTTMVFVHLFPYLRFGSYFFFILCWTTSIFPLVTFRRCDLSVKAWFPLVKYNAKLISTFLLFNSHDKHQRKCAIWGLCLFVL